MVESQSVDRADGARPVSIVRVTLNRPESRNALDLPMVDALHEALASIERDERVAAVIITGAGEKAFVAGADIAQLRDRRAPEAFQRINQGLFRRLEELPAPTIAAVRGWALGGGCELAMACDIRVAGESARFGQPEVALGIIPGAGGTHRLQRLCGVGKARELIFTGDIITATEAERIGLVNRVVPDDQLVRAAADLAERIAKNSIAAVRLAKLAIDGAPETGARGRDLFETLAQAICFESQDKFERMTAFLERKNK
ncbi:MAG: enoyl-CoA hydratase/isomerase family protein [Planctomycetes bacterium]|nr:enoyl-CoA hydratase/isomerase family protein [Planctomycetota bacterium]